MSETYLYWDGATRQPLQDSRWHDCILTRDLQYLSLNVLWLSARQAGFTPVIMFACKPDEEAHEVMFRGRIHGAFSAACFELLDARQHCPLGEAFSLINERFRKSGVDQTAEVLCTEQHLSKPFLNGDYIIISDACRIKETIMKQIANIADAQVDDAVDAAVNDGQLLHSPGKQCVFTFSGHGRRVFSGSF